ncbi:MAG TPA: hypothetical protein VE378_04190 [Nitrososphaeraceae archaeon]|nr:hypothetical protein [Nitrososphaeraceae archaeon]
MYLKRPSFPASFAKEGKPWPGFGPGTIAVPRLELELRRGPSPGDELQLRSEWVSSLRTYHHCQNRSIYHVIIF